MPATQEKYDLIAELAETGREPDALEIALPILEEDCNDARILFLIGFIFSRSEKWGLAYQVLKRCVELAPNNAVAWHNLGKSCYEMRKFNDAEQCWGRAAKLDPKLAAPLDGLGLIHLNRSQHVKALQYLDRVLAIDPDNVDSRVNRGMAKLGTYEWREGWHGYSANLGISKDRSERDYNGEPRWDGTPGLNIVCRAEQGLGDEISFGSCLPDLIRDSKSVVIECDRRMVGAFRRSFPQCEVFGTRYDKAITWNAGRTFDARVNFAELPRFYRNADEDFPGTPYLVASPEMRTQWRALFNYMGERPKIGLAWNGGRKQTGSERRSLGLNDLAASLKHDCDFISLEYREPTPDEHAAGTSRTAQEIEAARAQHGFVVHHWPHGVQSYDYDATLALIAELDLVISVTTTVVHAAGALGVPCWCLVPQNVMWRYGTTGSKFHWANSVELFRQSGSNWPLAEISKRLEERFNAASGKRAGEQESARKVA